MVDPQNLRMVSSGLWGVTVRDVKGLPLTEDGRPLLESDAMWYIKDRIISEILNMVNSRNGFAPGWERMRVAPGTVSCSASAPLLTSGPEKSELGVMKSFFQEVIPVPGRRRLSCFSHHRHKLDNQRVSDSLWPAHWYVQQALHHSNNFFFEFEKQKWHHVHYGKQ